MKLLLCAAQLINCTWLAKFKCQGLTTDRQQRRLPTRQELIITYLILQNGQWLNEQMNNGIRSTTHKRLKIRLFIRTEHNMRIFRVSYKMTLKQQLNGAKL